MQLTKMHCAAEIHSLFVGIKRIKETDEQEKVKWTNSMVPQIIHYVDESNIPNVFCMGVIQNTVVILHFLHAWLSLYMFVHAV